MLIDTHTHVNFSAFKKDADEVIRRALDKGIGMIIVGSQYTTSERAVQIAEKYPNDNVYAAIGLHPIHLQTGLVKIKIDKEEIKFQSREEEFDYEKYRALAKSSNKVVAIGEVGLDYYYYPKTKIKQARFKEKQKEVFIKQLNLAKELNLPVILHCEMAHDDLITTLQHYNNFTVKGVRHSFAGTLAQAWEYIKLGFYIGFNGLIFKKIPGLPDFGEIIKEIPLEKILVETDCPYLSPPPNIIRRGGLAPPQKEGRNEPLYVKCVAEKIAEIKNINYQEVENQTTKNAKDLFKFTFDV